MSHRSNDSKISKLKSPVTIVSAFVATAILVLMIGVADGIRDESAASLAKVQKISSEVAKTRWEHCNMHDQGPEIVDRLHSGKMITNMYVNKLEHAIEQCNDALQVRQRALANSAAQAKVAAEQLKALAPATLEQMASEKARVAVPL